MTRRKDVQGTLEGQRGGVVFATRRGGSNLAQVNTLNTVSWRVGSKGTLPSVQVNAGWL